MQLTFTLRTQTVHYITNITLQALHHITIHYNHYKLLTCLAAPLLGRRGEAAQSAVTREREEHADTGDLAAVDIGLWIGQ